MKGIKPHVLTTARRGGGGQGSGVKEEWEKGFS